MENGETLPFPQIRFNVEKRFWQRYFLRVEIITETGIRSLTRKLKRKDRDRKKQIEDLIRYAVLMVDPKASEAFLEEMQEHVETWVRM